MNFLNYRKYRYIRHLLLWLGVWLFFVYFFSYNFEDTPFVMVFSTILLPITAITTYIFTNYLIPKFLLAKKLFWFGIYTFFTLLFTTFCTVTFLVLSVAYIPGLRMDDLPPMSRNYIFILILVYLIVAIISALSLWKHNMQTARNNSQLQQRILEAEFRMKEQELEFLKSQLHPHFLFNTLNTIYSLALKQSKDTPDLILKLSALLDYILYQVKKPVVSLQQEINHIRNYVELEKIRFRDTLEIHFLAEEVDGSLQIAPMLLLPFVENAFKHGCIIDDKIIVLVKISTSGEGLHFNIKNSCNFKAFESGIGLENIKKRLEFLYPERYNLNIIPEEEFFTVDLKVNFHETFAYDAHH